MTLAVLPDPEPDAESNVLPIVSHGTERELNEVAALFVVLPVLFPQPHDLMLVDLALVTGGFLPLGTFVLGDEPLATECFESVGAGLAHELLVPLVDDEVAELHVLKREP